MYTALSPLCFLLLSKWRVYIWCFRFAWCLFYFDQFFIGLQALGDLLFSSRSGTHKTKTMRQLKITKPDGVKSGKFASVCLYSKKDQNSFWNSRRRNFNLSYIFLFYFVLSFIIMSYFFVSVFAHACMLLHKFDLLDISLPLFYRANKKNVSINFPGFGYGHPNGLHPFMLNPGWLDAAYMSYAFPEYFRQQPHNPQFAAKGKYPHSTTINKNSNLFFRWTNHSRYFFSCVG